MRVARANLADFSFEIELRPEQPKEIHLYFYFEWMTTEEKPRMLFKETAGDLYVGDAEELRDALTKAIRKARALRRKGDKK
jgi:hypothetical protein